MTVFTSSDSHLLFMQQHWPLLQSALKTYVISVSKAMIWVEHCLRVNDYEFIFHSTAVQIRANEWTAKMIEAMNGIIRYTHNTMNALIHHPRIPQRDIVYNASKFERIRAFCNRILLELDNSN